MKRLLYLSAALTLLAGCRASDSLYDNFVTPPDDARPRVWWHWMDGNITKDGIRKDLLWMKEAGIGGFHHFDAGMSIPQVVEKRLIYMDEGWKDAFGYATALADSLGFEMAIASAPGWSNTGGPWVSAEDAMKKLCWSETLVEGGRTVDIAVPEPPHTTGFFQDMPSHEPIDRVNIAGGEKEFYRDIAVLAIKLDGATAGMTQPQVVMSEGRDGSGGILTATFDEPRTVRSLSLFDGVVRLEWYCSTAQLTRHLEASHDGKTFKAVCDIPEGGAARQTIDIPETTATVFRVVYDRKPARTPELMLYPNPRVNHAEEKAGFATPHDMMEPVTPEDAPACAAAGVVDLSASLDADGRLVWEAPEGCWKIMRFGYSLTGKMNHPAPLEATGFEVDKLDRDAVRRYFDHYLDMYKEASGGLIGKKGIKYLLIDSYESGSETWTHRMAEEFQSRRGYSLIPWLPVLTGEIIGSAAESEKFLFDWRRTIGELISENLYSNAAEIAHSRGLKCYFESHENGRLYLADGMRVKRDADIPMAAMWAREGAGGAYHSMSECDIRESASVSHIYGQNIVALESFTSDGFNGRAYSFYPGNLKGVADLALSCGVNRFIIHESSHQPVDDRKPGLGLLVYGQWFNRHETWAAEARAWTDYLARSSYMMRQGRNVADILFYYGDDNCITGLFARSLPDIPEGYNFDYVNTDALLNAIKVRGGRITAPSGASYSVLVTGGNAAVNMSPEAAARIEEFRSAGVTVCGLEELGETLEGKGVARDFSVEDFTDLKYVHRSLRGCEIYWVGNLSDQPRSLVATFRTCGLKPELWHPETGKTEPVSYSFKDDTTVIPLELVGNDAVFVVFRDKASDRELCLTDEVILPGRTETVQAVLDGPWELSFDPSAGGPSEAVVMDTLQDWSLSEDDAVKYYSGTATYRTTFYMDPEERGVDEPALFKGRMILDLGRVGVIARVLVGGRDAGVLWKAPYRVDIGDLLRPGENELEIRVTNLWVNRIIGDCQEGCTHRYTYPAAEFYDASSALLPSGLMGPVTLIQRN